MLTTITEAARSGATVIPFPEPEEDIIPTITGICLADADAKVIARRLRLTAWEGRARFFNNIICESLDNWAKIEAIVPSKDDAADFLDWAFVEMMRRIGEVLDLWGEPEVSEPDAATVYELSLNPDHRKAAGQWRLKQDEEYGASILFVNSYVQKHWRTLAIFYRVASACMPGSRMLWQAGSLDCPVNDWPAPAGAA